MATAAASSASIKRDYEELAKQLKETSALEGINGLLSWDELVMMPESAASSRGAQKSALAGVLHDRHSSPELGELLSRLAEGGDTALETAGLGPYERATVRLARRAYRKATAIPKEMAQQEAELDSRGYQAWVKARQASDFAQFAPVLKEWVALRRKRAQLVDPSKPPLDVLLDDYEPGLTAVRLDEIFSQVKEGLVPLLADIRSRGTQPDRKWLEGDYDVKKQAEVCNALAVAMGFDLQRGRLDVSVHPFTGGAHPTDTRMTTRFKQHDLMEGLTGAIHETGHSLYEQGRNPDFDGLPVSEAHGMGLHESQSLLWERMVALSEPFAAYLLPKLRETFPELPANKSPADLHAAINVVRHPSLIRVEADEVTYPLHIILRYELERGLIEGSIDVDDLPRLWNEKMQQYLCVTPDSDAKGVLQDVHWASGAFGYFPTYSLGAMYACQIFAAAQKELPGLSEDIAAGRFSPLREWLREKIHKVGSLHASGDDMLQAVTGSPLDPSVFLTYLTEKYTKLYKL